MKRFNSIKAISLTLVLAFLTFGILLYSCDSDNDRDRISGFVLSGNQPLEGMIVTIRSSGTEKGIEVLGNSETDSTGFFEISFNAPTNPKAILYITADSNVTASTTSGIVPDFEFVRLVTVFRDIPFDAEIVINERTTVATAYTMAQFFTPNGIDGPSPGLQNAADIAQNLVNLSNGEVSNFLNNSSNSGTSTRPTFNSLANMLASCVRSESNCDTLFEFATTPSGLQPTNTLRAISNIARFPWQNVQGLFELSQEETIYNPALSSDIDITAWTLALIYVGNGMELDGPGNIAFDADGNAWVCNNYIFNPGPVDPDDVVCGDDHVLKFTPMGDDAPGAPFQGGGLYGAGYGITLDPEGNVWVGNFGFQGANCPLDFEELSQSVSKFTPDGTPISPNSEGNDPGGFKGAGNFIQQPQGVVSDRDRNIWIASCSSDSIVQFPQGKPELSFNIQPLDDMGESLVIKPFDVAIDTKGNAWVTGNESNSVIAVDKEGDLLHSLTGDAALEAGIFLPMGAATDTLGNVWIANSGITKIICDGTTVPTLIDIIALTEDPFFTGPNASVTMISGEGSATGPFKGGGLLVPWGIAVDGNNNIWISNFQGSAVSQLCGASTENCPPGFDTGDPISPNGGYFFDGLKRNTAVEIDPSGNVWATNNWEIFAVAQNPGGRSLVVFVGLAKPVQAPLIGPPQ
ncbi:MAG: hypothetical protein WBB48_01855 [Thermodesulfobacteriota bacterium]